MVKDYCSEILAVYLIMAFLTWLHLRYWICDMEDREDIVVQLLSFIASFLWPMYWVIYVAVRTSHKKHK